MSHHPIFIREGRRGFYLIGLLIVLAIIFILIGKQWGPSGTDAGMATISIDRSQAAACTANRAVVTTMITAWGVNHPNEAATIEKVAASGQSVPRCPEGGVYEIGPDRTIYCTIHNPKPTVTPGY